MVYRQLGLLPGQQIFLALFLSGVEKRLPYSITALTSARPVNMDSAQLVRSVKMASDDFNPLIVRSRGFDKL